MEKNIVDLLDQVRSIAQLGLNFSKDPYDRERYTRLPGQYQQPHSSVHVLYLCRRLGDLRIWHESLAMEHRDPDTIKNWHRDHREQAAAARALISAR
jgi:hypothetical protein